MRQPGERSRLGYRIFYGIALFAILIVWVYAFKSYFEHYDSIHPEIAWAVPWMEVDSVTAKGIFLWNETRLASPRDGSVRFPMGSGPVRVFKGAPRIKRIGIPDAFIEHGSIPELFQQCGMDAESILKAIRQSRKRNEPITEEP